MFATAMALGAWAMAIYLAFHLEEMEKRIEKLEKKEEGEEKKESL